MLHVKYAYILWNFAAEYMECQQSFLFNTEQQRFTT